jgi:hypothetical protein
VLGGHSVAAEGVAHCLGRLVNHEQQGVPDVPGALQGYKQSPIVGSNL